VQSSTVTVIAKALNELADQIIQAPDGPSIYFGYVWWLDNRTGAVYPGYVGSTGPFGGQKNELTNLAAVVVNPAGQVVTMFPTTEAYMMKMIAKP
jgi:hypothetical protein